MKPSSAKAKGREFQNDIAGKFSDITGIEAGKDCLIQGREMGQAGTDIKFYAEAAEKLPFSIECKRQENLSLPAWIKQARANTKKGTDWLLFWRRSREKISRKTFLKCSIPTMLSTTAKCCASNRNTFWCPRVSRTWFATSKSSTARPGIFYRTASPSS